MPLSFVAIQGPAADVSQKFEGILAQEAAAAALLLSLRMPAAIRCRSRRYLDAYLAPDGKAGFSWVMDTSENGRTRSGRVRGAATLGATSGSPWNALDEAAMRQIANEHRGSGAAGQRCPGKRCGGDHTNASQDEAQ